MSEVTENPIEETPSSEENSGPPQNSLLSAMAGEYFGTFVLVFFGVGSVNAAVATNFKRQDVSMPVLVRNVMVVTFFPGLVKK